MPDGPAQTPRNYNLKAFREIAGIPGTDAGEQKITALLSLIMQSEAHRTKALAFCAETNAFRHNKFQYKAVTDENGQQMLEEEAKQAGVEECSIPWSLGKAQLRLAVYASFAPRHNISVGSGRLSDRATAEICAALDSREVMPELDRTRLQRCDKMTFGCHTVVKAIWDPTLGQTVREAVTAESKTTRGMNGTVIGEPGKALSFYEVGRSTKNAQAGLFRKKEVVEETVVYHVTDDRGRRKWTEHKTGGVRYIPLSAVEFNLDPLAHDIRDARYVYDQKRVLADSVYELYPGKTDEIEKIGWWSEELAVNSTERQIRSITQQSCTNPELRTAVLTDFYMKSSEQFGFPSGLHAVWISRDATGNGVGEACLLLEWDKWPFRALPHKGGAVEIYDGDDFWGSNYMRASAPAQMLTNELLSLAIDSIKNGSTVILGMTDTQMGDEAGIVASDITGLPQGKMVRASRTQDIKLLSNQQQSDRQLAASKTVMDYEDIVTMTRVAHPGTEELATEVNRAMEQDKSMTGMVLSRLAQQDIDLKVAGFVLFQRHCSFADLKVILSEFDESEIRDFIDCDLESKCRLEMRGSILAEDPTFIFTLLKFLPQFGDEWKSIWPPRVLADLLASEKKFGHTPRDDQRELQERENAKMRRGYVQPWWGHDHDTHIEEAEAYIARNYLSMSKQELDDFRKHIEEHERFKRERAVEQAKNVLMAQMEAQAAVQKVQEAAAIAQGTAPAPAPTAPGMPQQRPERM